MRKIISIILVCTVFCVTLSFTSVSAANNTSKIELIELLQFNCWDFDYTPEYWYNIYTKESYNAYLAAKQKAEKLIADENTTDDEFNKMIQEFESARNNLVRVKQTEPTTQSSEPTETIVQSTTVNQQKDTIIKTDETNTTIDTKMVQRTTSISGFEDSNAVQTDDGRNVMIWVVILFISFVIAIGGTFFIRKKKFDK